MTVEITHAEVSGILLHLEEGERVFLAVDHDTPFARMEKGMLFLVREGRERFYDLEDPGEFADAVEQFADEIADCGVEPKNLLFS